MGISGAKLIRNLLNSIRSSGEQIVANRSLYWPVDEKYWGVMALSRVPSGPNESASLNCMLGVFHEPCNRLYCAASGERFSLKGIVLNSSLYFPSLLGYSPLVFFAEEPTQAEVQNLFDFKINIGIKVTRDLADTNKILDDLFKRSPNGGGAAELAVCMLLTEGRQRECDDFVRSSDNWPITKLSGSRLMDFYRRAVSVREKIDWKSN